MVSDADKRRAKTARDARVWVEETIQRERNVMLDAWLGNDYDADKARAVHSYGKAMSRFHTNLVCDLEADHER